VSRTPLEGQDQGLLGNRLLDALPPGTRHRISPLLAVERVHLKQVLYQPGERIEVIWFPLTTVVSILTTLSGGAWVELATVGNEGMLGTAFLFGSMPGRVFCQVHVPGESLRIDRQSLIDVVSGDDFFRSLIQLHVQANFTFIAQQVACNVLHGVRERCSRWLLLTHDRVHCDTFPLTHELLAKTLGVRRASVTLAARALQSAGLIHYRRGEVAIIDREGLEGASCECYRVLREELDNLPGPVAGRMGEGPKSTGPGP